MKTITVTIKGLSSLLMNRFPLVPVEALSKKSPQEQAEVSAYRTDQGELYVPGVNFHRALIAGAAFSKGKGRASLQKEVASAVFVQEMALLLGQKKFEVDSRAVVVPATKGRIVRHRARLDAWELTATVDYDETLLTEAQLRRIVDDTGQRVGLLDFRPEKKGPFGRFMVTSWK